MTKYFFEFFREQRGLHTKYTNYQQYIHSINAKLGYKSSGRQVFLFFISTPFYKAYSIHLKCITFERYSYYGQKSSEQTRARGGACSKS